MPPLTHNLSHNRAQEEQAFFFFFDAPPAVLTCTCNMATLLGQLIVCRFGKGLGTLTPKSNHHSGGKLEGEGKLLVSLNLPSKKTFFPYLPRPISTACNQELHLIFTTDKYQMEICRARSQESQVMYI